jgi:C_GCAxxG_C_C family probable redox protein
MNKKDDAIGIFNGGFNCAQSVFTALSGDFGMSRETALRVSAAFGGGVSRAGELCGAVSGGLMAIGMKYGQIDPSRPEDKANTYRIGKEFMERFRKENGSCICRELMACEVGTPEGQAKIRELGLHEKVCAKAVLSAVSIIENMI